MSDAPGQLSEAVAALVRKSRISLVSTLLILGLLGGSIVFLSFQIFEKRQELATLNAQKDATQKDIAGLQAQIDQKKAELAAATTQVRNATIAQFVKRLDATANVSSAVIQSAARDASHAGRLVYIQYSNTTAASAMKQLQADLVANGYVAPGVETLSPRFFDKTAPNVVRYFHAEDEDAARAVADVANASLAKSCPGKAVVLVPKLAWAKNPQATTQLEIWSASGCHEAKVRGGAMPQHR